jgi:predicted aspartyl protease
MGAAEMGRIVSPIKVENASDLALVRAGKIPVDQVRGFEIPDALVDTGAGTLALSPSMLRRLGLDTPSYTKKSRNTTGSHDVNVYGPIYLTIGDRSMTVDAMEIAEDCPVLIGQIPLEFMQFVIDMTTHKLIPSPANNGQWVLDMF